MILLLLNFSTREKEKSSRGAPALSAWRRGPLFQWACRKKPTDLDGPPGRHTTARVLSCPSLAPLRSFPLPAPVGATRAWVGGRVQNAARGGKARRHEATAPRAQTHRSGSADPPPPLLPLFGPFHCTRPRKLLTSGLTAPALTPHSLLDDLDRSPAWRVEKLASERGLGTAPALEPSVPIHRVTYATFP